VKVECKKLEFFTNDKSKLRILEDHAVKQKILHEKTYTKCIAIKTREEKTKNNNRKIIIKTISRCGEILSIERVNPHDVAIPAIQRILVLKLIEHNKNCLKCTRINKLNVINKNK
jgi:hypothetical protein